MHPDENNLQYGEKDRAFIDDGKDGSERMVARLTNILVATNQSDLDVARCFKSNT